MIQIVYGCTVCCQRGNKAYYELLFSVKVSAQKRLNTLLYTFSKILYKILYKSAKELAVQIILFCYSQSSWCSDSCHLVKGLPVTSHLNLVLFKFIMVKQHHINNTIMCLVLLRCFINMLAVTTPVLSWIFRSQVYAERLLYMTRKRHFFIPNFSLCLGALGKAYRIIMHFFSRFDASNFFKSNFLLLQ